MSDEEIELASKRFSDNYVNDVQLEIAIALIASSGDQSTDYDTIPF
jgi:hypothetical protein